MGTVVGSQGALKSPDSPPVTMQYVYTVEHRGQNTDGALVVTKRAGGASSRAGGEILHHSVR